jgi:hypothetical protein
MAVGLFEIDSATATPMIDLHILLRERTASEWNTGLFDTLKDRVEFRVAHVKGVVKHVEVVPTVEIERDEQKRERLTGRTRNIIAWP